MSETTLRDTIEQAIEEHSEPAVETPVSETSERVRDEAGRFARKQEEPEAAKVDPVEAPAEPERKAVPRPSSWKKDYEQDWETLPDRIREYINEREGQFATGVSTYRSQFEQARPIYEAVQPFMQDLQQHNINPAQWIQNLGSAHRTLVMGSPQEKVEMFARLATEYGIPLESLVGQQANPQFGMLAQELSQIKNQWQQFQQTQQQQEMHALEKQIEDFKANAPHFDAVRETMGQLLQSGLATDLQSAYDKAIRMNDDIWQQQQAEQAQKAEAERQKAIAEKKAKAVSPKSASPTGAMIGGNGNKSLRDQLAAAVDAHLGGHI